MASDHQDPIDLRRLRVPEDGRTRRQIRNHRLLVVAALLGYAALWLLVAWGMVSFVDWMTR